MEPRSEPIGTQGNKRSSSNKTRKKFSLRPNFYVTTLVLFFSLLAVKVVISGIFLQSSPLGITTTDVAMAQEVPAVNDRSYEELDLKLRKREQELLDKEAKLKKLEAQLLPLKKEVENSMAELNDLQNTLAAKAKKLAEREKALQDAKITHLVKIYSSMEAKKAAETLDRLQLDTVVKILGNMKGKSAGAIMAELEPEKGATISRKLCEK